MLFGNKDINIEWVVSKTQTEFVDYALTSWSGHDDMKGKTKKQKTDWLKAVYKQCKEAIGEQTPIDVAPDVDIEGEQKGAE